MFLAIDIGNTAVTIGYFQDHLLRGVYNIPSAIDDTSEQLGALILKLLEESLGEGVDIKGVGISSVVPARTDLYLSIAKRFFQVKPMLLSHNLDLGFRILYDDPAQLGTDRLANVIAARKLYGYPALVVDLGTATKYDVIDNAGDYQGGLIAPGVNTAASALFEKGARLFPVKLERPQRLIGKNTTEALQSGIYYGFLGQLAYLIERIREEVGYPDLKVVATGGYADLFGENLSLFNDVDPGLTLKGIEIAFNR